MMWSVAGGLRTAPGLADSVCGYAGVIHDRLEESLREGREVDRMLRMI